jgi:hypothetical protein
MMFASLSTIILYIGLYLYRKCENPELFDKNTFVYSIITGMVVFFGLNYYTPTTTGYEQPGVYTGVSTTQENIMTEPFKY